MTRVGPAPTVPPTGFGSGGINHDDSTWPEGRQPLVAPVAVRTVDLGAAPQGLRLTRSDSRPPYRSLLAVARGGDRALGMATFAVGEGGWVSRERLWSGLSSTLGADVVEGYAGADGRSGEPFSRPHRPLRVRGAEVPRAATSVSVVVATCANVHALERCVRSIVRSDYEGQWEVIVVENRPAISETRNMLAAEFPEERRVRYVEEPRPGASRARNAGLARARGDLVAFVDDDVVVDPGWMRLSADALTQSSEVACCTGLILPLELETPSQLLLEQFAAFGKGFRPKTYRLPDARQDDPLLPYTAGSIGSGANMTLKRAVVRRLGGFDPVLGPGTPTTGAEDLDLLVRVLQAGHALMYEPSAIVWHRHPDGMPRLSGQAFRYGVGLGSMLAKRALAGPERVELLRAIPSGLRYLRDPSSRKNASRPFDFPRRLIWRERVGMLIGPLAYVTSAVASLRTRGQRVAPGHGE